MGTCASNQQVNYIRGSKQAHTKLNITCPICEEVYDINHKKPYFMCPNDHQMCNQCLTSIRAKHIKQKKDLKCPFCNQICPEDTMSIDKQVYNFLKQEEQTLKLLPQNSKKLFAFSKNYLPALHNLIKREIRAATRKEVKLESLDTIRIKGRMLEEFEVFEMDIFECLPNLKNLHLNKNQIKAIDTVNYSRDTIQFLNMANNQILGMKQLLSDGKKPLKYLKTLILSNNKIEEIGGLSLLQHLQIVNLSSNNIASMKGLECPQTLRHLNLEFNAIKEVQYSDFCSKLFSLRLFGNPVRAECWGKVMEKDWSELRVLTASIKAHTLKAKQSQCATLKQQLRTLNQVFQLGVIESIEGKEVEKWSKTKPIVFECFNQNFKAAIQNKESGLRKAMYEAINWDPLGKNINFKTEQYNNKIYEFDSKLWRYKKIGVSDDPANYLYSQRSYRAKDQKTKYMSIAVSCENFIIGACQFIAGSTKTVEFDLGMMLVRGSNLVQESLKPIQEGKQAQGKEVVCQLTVNCASSKLELWIEGIKRHSMVLSGQKWQEYKFFVSLNQKGSWMRVLHQQMCQEL